MSRGWAAVREKRAIGVLIGLMLAAAVSLSMAGSARAVQLGVNVTSWDETPLLANAGATVVRGPLERNQTLNGTNWTSYDAAFKEAWESGVTMIPVLWIGGKTGPYPTSPAEMAQWNEWVAKAVNRYGVGGAFWVGKANPKPAVAWEVWNEPNLEDNSPKGEVEAKSYGTFLASTASVIRANGGPGTQVLFGGLASYAGNVPGYLETATKAAGGPSAYDGFSLHPYGWDTDAPKKLAAVEARVKEARSALKNLGVPNKPIWVTEIGWPVGNGASNQSVNEDEQADLLTKTFNYLKATPNVESIIWYNARDAGGTTWDGYTGLRKTNGYVRPSWWSFVQQTGVAAWSPSAWYMDELGGEATSNPDLASWGSGRLDMVVRGADNALWHRWYQTGLGWSVWERVGGTLISGPSVVSWGNGRLDVVAAAANGSVAHWWWESGSWHSDNLGGAVAAGTDPDISSGQQGRLDVYIKGTDGALWHKWYYPSAGWSAWEKIGGSLASGPGAVSWGPGRYDVVARLSNNTIQHWWYANGWHTDNLGGSLASGPDIASPEPGRLDVFASSSESSSGVWQTTFKNGSGWSVWGQMGAEILGGPGAVAWGSGRIDVVGWKPGGGFRHYWWQP